MAWKDADLGDLLLVETIFYRPWMNFQRSHQGGKILLGGIRIIQPDISALPER